MYYCDTFDSELWIFFVTFRRRSCSPFFVMSTNSKIESKLIMVCGKNSTILYFDSENGHVYHVQNGSRFLTCAAHLLSVPNVAVLDDRPQAGGRKETYEQAIALIKETVSLSPLFKNCSAHNMERHNHDPPHRLFYEWTLFRWVCQLTAIVHHRRGHYNTEAVVKEVFSSWPRVLSLDEANVLKFYRKPIGQMFEHLKQNSPWHLKIFLLFNNLKMAVPFFRHMDTSQTYWNEPELCILRK